MLLEKSYRAHLWRMEDYSTHDETCTLYTVYSVQYVVYISMVSPKYNFSISYREGHSLFCFVLAKFRQIGEKNEIWPHISIYMYIFTCLYAKFRWKIFANNFDSAKFCQNFGNINLGSVISFRHFILAKFFSAQIFHFRENPTYIFPLHVREGPVQRLGHRMLIGW